MMTRLILILLLVQINAQAVFACFCVGNSFCEYLQEINADESALVFVGSFIQEEELSIGSYAMQFKVDNVLKGDIVTPNSSIYDGEAYINTDTTVWLYSGSTAACYRYLHRDSQAVFAVYYNSPWTPSFEEVGYVPTICANDYFPISDDGTITGRLWSISEDATLALTDFIQLIETNCTSTVEDEYNQCLREVVIYPQPAQDYISIRLPSCPFDWDVHLYDLNGRRIMAVHKERVDISQLGRGVYFLSFEKGEYRYVRKVIKS